MAPPSRCTYLRCEVPPTVLISPPYGVDWAARAEHAPGMIKALAIGHSQSVDVTTRPIKAEPLRAVA